MNKKTLVIGDEYFSKKFDNTIVIGKNENLAEPVASHPDMNLCIIREKAFISKGSDLKDILFKKGYEVITVEKELKPEYPFDVLFNAKIIGNTAVLNPKTVAKEILDYCQSENINIIPVNQGYCACSVTAITENAFITSDKGIETALNNNGKSVLRITEGYIDIDKYDYGFIGGASGFSNGILYFFGDITAHPDFDKIDLFLKENNIDYKYFNCPLTDIGGCIEI